MNWNNKYKFSAAVAGLFLVPFLLISRHFIYGESELQKNDTLRYLGLRTLTGAGIISDVLNLNYNLARVAGARLAGGQAALKQDLAARAQENPFIYSELALLGPSGAELARFPASSSKPRLDYAKNPVFSEAKVSLAPAGAVEYGEYTPPALVLAEPLLRGGSPAYYLAGRLSLAYLGEVVRMMGRNSYGSFGLVDMGGQVIADSMSMSIVKPGLKAPPEVLKLLSMASESEAPNFSSPVLYRGRTLLVSVSNVAGTKWWVYEIMDANDAPVRRASSWAWRVMLSGVLLILLFSAVTYRLAVYWLKPQAGPAPRP
jgi:hypothetical protein